MMIPVSDDNHKREILFLVLTHYHEHQGLDPLIRSVSESYNCSVQRFFGLPIVLLPCGL